MTAWILYYAQWSVAVAQTLFVLWLGVRVRRNVIDREWPWWAWIDEGLTHSEAYAEQSAWRR